MPRGRKLWYAKKSHNNAYAAPRQQCCVVCYSAFQPYSKSASRWESSMTKVFYKAMNIPPFQTGGDEDAVEDEDVLLSLPYCPECHSKISVMFNLYTQLENLQNQYAIVRNEIAFIVVETINRNAKRGPMDFIRQQIFQKWKDFYMEETAKGDYHEVLGLDALIAGNHFDLNEMFAETDDQDSEPEEPRAKGRRRQTAREDYDGTSSNMMELQFNESDNEMNSDGETDSLSLLPHDPPDNEMLSGHFLDGSFDDPGTPSKRRRGRPRGSANSMPRLIPMKRGGSKSLLKSGRGNRHGGSDQHNFGGHFLAGMNANDDSLSNDGNAETPPGENALNNQHDEGQMMMEAIEANAAAAVAASAVATKPTNGQDAETSEDVKPSRYPKRSLRSTVIKEEPQEEMFDEVNDNWGDESYGESAAAEEFPQSTDGIFQCRLCPKFYTNGGRLLRHESLCHPSLKSIHCETCGKGFSSRLTYRRHRLTFHAEVTEGTVKCPICYKTFLRKYSLEIHMKSHRPRGRGGRRGRGGSGGTTRNELSLLKPILNGEASNASSTGSSPVKTLSSPEKSRSEPSEADGNDGLTCGICNKSFPYKTLLNVHFLTHAKKNFKCETCNAVFTSHAEMKTHVEDVHRNKTLKCPVCNQGFTAVEQLQRHSRTHDLKVVKQEVADPGENESQEEESFEEPPTTQEA